MLLLFSSCGRDYTRILEGTTTYLEPPAQLLPPEKRLPNKKQKRAHSEDGQLSDHELFIAELATTAGNIINQSQRNDHEPEQLEQPTKGLHTVSYFNISSSSL